MKLKCLHYYSMIKAATSHLLFRYSKYFLEITQDRVILWVGTSTKQSYSKCVYVRESEREGGEKE